MSDLAEKAQAHIDAGGCSGDFCRKCAGKGYYKEKTPRGTTLFENCWPCNKTGLGR